MLWPTPFELLFLGWLGRSTSETRYLGSGASHARIPSQPSHLHFASVSDNLRIATQQVLGREVGGSHMAQENVPAYGLVQIKIKDPEVFNERYS